MAFLWAWSGTAVLSLFLLMRLFYFNWIFKFPIFKHWIRPIIYENTINIPFLNINFLLNACLHIIQQLLIYFMIILNQLFNVKFITVNLIWFIKRLFQKFYNQIYVYLHVLLNFNTFHLLLDYFIVKYFVWRLFFWWWVLFG